MFESIDQALRERENRYFDQRTRTTKTLEHIMLTGYRKNATTMFIWVSPYEFSKTSLYDDPDFDNEPLLLDLGGNPVKMHIHKNAIRAKHLDWDSKEQLYVNKGSYGKYKWDYRSRDEWAKVEETFVPNSVTNVIFVTTMKEYIECMELVHVNPPVFNDEYMERIYGMFFEEQMSSKIKPEYAMGKNSNGKLYAYVKSATFDLTDSDKQEERDVGCVKLTFDPHTYTWAMVQGARAMLESFIERVCRPNCDYRAFPAWVVYEPATVRCVSYCINDWVEDGCPDLGFKCTFSVWRGTIRVHHITYEDIGISISCFRPYLQCHYKDFTWVFDAYDTMVHEIDDEWEGELTPLMHKSDCFFTSNWYMDGDKKLPVELTVGARIKLNEILQPFYNLFKDPRKRARE